MTGRRWRGVQTAGTRCAVLAESWSRLVAFVPALRRPVVALALIGAVKAGVLACLLGGWWVAHQWPTGGLVAEGVAILWSGAFMVLGFFPRRASYRQRYGDLAYERLFFRCVVPFAVGGLTALFLPILIPGPPVLPTPAAYAAAAYLLVTALLMEWRGKALFWDLDWRAFVYTVFPDRGHVITSGLFRWLRHPVYSAFVRFVTAAALIRNNAPALGAAALLAAGLTVLAWVEERDLEQREPAYAAYRRRTPAFFVAWPLPFLRHLVTGVGGEAAHADRR